MVNKRLTQADIDAFYGGPTVPLILALWLFQPS